MVTTGYLNLIITDILNPPVSTPNLNSLTEISINEINSNSELIQQENTIRNNHYHNIRNAMFNNWNWRSRLSRSGSLLALGLSSYFGQLYLTPFLSTISISSVFSNTLMNSNLPLNRVLSVRNPHWEDVSSSFFTSWELLFKYFNPRNN